MRKRIAPLLVCLLFLVASATPLYSWPWGPEIVTIINGQKFTIEDVESWWQNWKEKDTSFPDNATSYENWHLMAQEALRMGLDKEPSFKHKIDVFLKARTLLVYRGENIDSQISITEKQQWDRYVEKYTPALRVHVFYFNDRKQADTAYSSLSSGKGDLDFAQITREMNNKQKASVFYEEKLIRPAREAVGWKPILERMQPGDFSNVFAWSKGFVLLFLDQRLAPDKEDFNTLSKKIEKELRETQVATLTEKLIVYLKQIYNVQVNEEVFAAIEIDGDNRDLLDKTILTMAGLEISARMFLAKLTQENKFRNQYGFIVDDPKKMKQRVLDGIIAQTLTSQAALDQHYEKKPPLLPIYTFYRQHRLIKELEKRLMADKIMVTEEEVNSYYQEHKADFSSLDTLSFAVIKDEKKLIDTISAALKQGDDFFDESIRYYSQEVEIQRLSEESIDADTLALLKTMVPGEVSRPVADGTMHKIVKFIKRTPGKVVPFVHVREMIRQSLEKKKTDTIRGDFLARLRNSSSIETSEKVWVILQKKIGEFDESSTL
jgi:hypothetical protein